MATAASGAAQIDGLLRELEAATGQARAVCAGLSASELTRRPDERKWSVAECVEHLNLTSRAYLPLLDAALERMRAEGLRGEGSYRKGWMGRLMVWMLQPPARMRVKTTQQFVPVEVGAPEQVLPRLLELQRELARRFEACRGSALDRAKIPSPFNARLSYDVYSCLAILPAHQRRHLWQAERARAALTD